MVGYDKIWYAKSYMFWASSRTIYSRTIRGLDLRAPSWTYPIPGERHEKAWFLHFLLIVFFRLDEVVLLTPLLRFLHLFVLRRKVRNDLKSHRYYTVSHLDFPTRVYGRWWGQHHTSAETISSRVSYPCHRDIWKPWKFHRQSYSRSRPSIAKVRREERLQDAIRM
jgi:hypothetical protein